MDRLPAYRAYVAWRGREDDLRDHSRRLSSFVTALGALHPKLKKLRFMDGGSPKVASDAASCQRALEAHQVDWATGDTKRVAYQPELFLDRKAASPVSVKLTCGIEPLNLGPIYTPNRLDLLVRRDASDGLVSREVLEGALRAAVESFAPDWGFLGVDGLPEPPLAVFSEGKPVVGWMVYFSVRYPEIPAALPRPSVAYVLSRRGTLIAAHPELFNERDQAHRDAVEALRAALEEAGVLIPAELLNNPPER